MSADNAYTSPSHRVGLDMNLLIEASYLVVSPRKYLVRGLNAADGAWWNAEVNLGFPVIRATVPLFLAHWERISSQYFRGLFLQSHYTCSGQTSVSPLDFRPNRYRVLSTRRIPEAFIRYSFDDYSVISTAIKSSVASCNKNYAVGLLEHWIT